jgi:hypothetical protein
VLGAVGAVAWQTTRAAPPVGPAIDVEPAVTG